MSFILDALKKAESERNRASGPVLVDVRIASPRRRLPAWAWTIGAVLLANLLVLAWLVMRKPATPVQPAAASVAAPPSAAPAPTVTATEPAPASTTAPAPSAVYTPPPAALPVPPPPAARRVPVDQLPTAKELIASGASLPPLLMNLHVYDPTPSQRYVLLNGVRLTEGEFTPDGIKVETITERGVVLEARGQRFLLPIGS
jgi:general secretion pathway protein B